MMIFGVILRKLYGVRRVYTVRHDWIHTPPSPQKKFLKNECEILKLLNCLYYIVLKDKRRVE